MRKNHDMLLKPQKFCTIITFPLNEIDPILEHWAIDEIMWSE